MLFLPGPPSGRWDTGTHPHIVRQAETSLSHVRSRHPAQARPGQGLTERLLNENHRKDSHHVLSRRWGAALRRGGALLVHAGPSVKQEARGTRPAVAVGQEAHCAGGWGRSLLLRTAAGRGPTAVPGQGGGWRRPGCPVRPPCASRALTPAGWGRTRRPPARTCSCRAR